jgi:hypothetical protein
LSLDDRAELPPAKKAFDDYKDLREQLANETKLRQTL